jgi:hypothetical protein
MLMSKILLGEAFICDKRYDIVFFSLYISLSLSSLTHTHTHTLSLYLSLSLSSLSSLSISHSLSFFLFLSKDLTVLAWKPTITATSLQRALSLLYSTLHKFCHALSSSSPRMKWKSVYKKASNMAASVFFSFCLIACLLQEIHYRTTILVDTSHARTVPLVRIDRRYTLQRRMVFPWLHWQNHSHDLRHKRDSKTKREMLSKNQTNTWRNSILTSGCHRLYSTQCNFDPEDRSPLTGAGVVMTLCGFCEWRKRGE